MVQEWRTDNLVFKFENNTLFIKDEKTGNQWFLEHIDHLFTFEYDFRELSINRDTLLLFTRTEITHPDFKKVIELPFEQKLNVYELTFKKPKYYIIIPRKFEGALIKMSIAGKEYPIFRPPFKNDAHYLKTLFVALFTMDPEFHTLSFEEGSKQYDILPIDIFVKLMPGKLRKITRQAMKKRHPIQRAFWWLLWYTELLLNSIFYYYTFKLSVINRDTRNGVFYALLIDIIDHELSRLYGVEDIKERFIVNQEMTFFETFQLLFEFTYWCVHNLRSDLPWENDLSRLREQIVKGFNYQLSVEITDFRLNNKPIKIKSEEYLDGYWYRRFISERINWLIEVMKPIFEAERSVNKYERQN